MVNIHVSLEDRLHSLFGLSVVMGIETLYLLYIIVNSGSDECVVTEGYCVQTRRALNASFPVVL